MTLVRSSLSVQSKARPYHLSPDRKIAPPAARRVPVISDLAGWFISKALPAISKVGGYLSTTFGPIITKLVGWFTKSLLPALMSAYQKYLPALRSAFESVKKALSSMQPFFDLLGKIRVEVLIPALGWVARTLLTLVGKAFEVVGAAIGDIGRLGVWLWNNVFQPVFKFILNGIAFVINGFADMLGALGHVPGFGWAKDASNALHSAADGAKNLADNLKQIPSSKHVQITVDTHINANSISGHYAGLVSHLDQPYLKTGKSGP